jgi:hypothetical protein
MPLVTSYSGRVMILAEIDRSVICIPRSHVVRWWLVSDIHSLGNIKVLVSEIVKV